MPSGGEATPLSALLGGFRLSGQTWCYADLGPGSGFSVPSGPAVVFHAVLHGTVRLTCPGSGTAELGAGEAAAVLTGEAHALRLTPDSAAPTLEFLREERGADVPPAFAFETAGGVVARVLSGRLSVELPAGASRTGLPSLLRIGAAAEAPWAPFVRSGALARAGIGPGGCALLTCLAETIIVATLRAEPNTRQFFAAERPDPIRQALQLIAGNPSANWTVERLARSVGMGRSNFAAHFTAGVGRAPMEVVAEARMEQAAQLLRNGNLKIAEISELSGYGSEAAFSRRFTRYFGTSPSQMREAARARSEAPTPPPAWRPLLSGRRTKDAATLRRLGAPGAPPKG
ncbi:MAG: helix-turn-helix transcriptional regulator [Novosphingobium sp.]|nr:helix-turn-helix transcriptional regulator [Novosphingobium sp.]